MTLDGTAVTVARPDAQVSWSQINSPSVEALTEFSVEAGGFKAETGHASGGTISFVSKSGTNDFHGDAYEFLRNQDLDARGFFAATQARLQTERLRRHRWADRCGFPKYTTAATRRSSSSPTRASAIAWGPLQHPYSVPPPEFFTGDLHNWVNSSGKMIQIYDPSTTTLVNGTYQRTPYPNNQIPQSQFDPVAKAIADYVQPSGTAERSGSGPRHFGVRPQQRRFLRHCPESAKQVQHQGRPGDHRRSRSSAFLFSRTREQDLGCGNSHLHPAFSVFGQSRVQPVGRLSPQLRLHPLPDLAEPLLRGRKQLAAEPRVVYHLFRRPAGRRNSHPVHGLEEQGDLHTQLARLQPRLSHREFFQLATPGVWAPRTVRTISWSNSGTT